MKTQGSPSLGAPGTGRAPVVPCLPDHSSHLGRQPCGGWRQLGKGSRIPPQNGYQETATEGRKDVKLPFLGGPTGPADSKGGPRQNGSVPRVGSSHGSERRCTYFHFSSPVRLAVKPPACKPRCNVLGGSPQGGPLVACTPLASSTRQSLMAGGATCGPLPRPGASLLPQIRPKVELHVYVPNVKENADTVSVDEGFLEEMDNRPSSLRLPDF